VPRATVTLVVAAGRNRVIGRQGEIPWRLPGEQAMFKALTIGHVLVMGRLTYDSIGRPLPGRRTVVVTRQPDWQPSAGPHPDVHVADGVEAALALAGSLDPEVFVVGGGEIYAATLPRADAMVVTWVDAEPEGDAYFPEFDHADWTVTSQSDHDGYTVVHYQRARS
jgi:dihydrofolate reductase